jgi:hypothetical protein
VSFTRSGDVSQPARRANVVSLVPAGQSCHPSSEEFSGCRAPADANRPDILTIGRTRKDFARSESRRNTTSAVCRGAAVDLGALIRKFESPRVQPCPQGATQHRPWENLSQTASAPESGPVTGPLSSPVETRPIHSRRRTVLSLISSQIAGGSCRGEGQGARRP